MACTLVESYLYACPKVGYARNRSRTACFNEGFLKQAILGSKRLAEEQVDSHEQRSSSEGEESILRGRLPGGSSQQVSYKATTLTRNIQQTSVMQQLPLAHPVCRRNRTEASWYLQRTQ